MTTTYRHCLVAILFFHAHPIIWANESDSPKPVPQARRSMLEALDKLKSRTARLPLSDAKTDTRDNVKIERPDTDIAQSRSLGIVNNGRMRALYLPEELSRRTNSTSQPRTESDITYQLATELFWIVSRVNNCHYCLGHQEDILLKVGVSESDLLLLDTDWSGFSAKHQAALAFTKKLSHQPHHINRTDIDAMQLHYTTDEILEIAFLIGRYNSTNRWTDSLGIPQESHRQFNTKLDPSQLEIPSVVTVQATSDRPMTANYQQWQQRLNDEAKVSGFAKQYGNAEGNLTVSVQQLLETIQSAGKGLADQVQNARHIGKLDPALKAKIAFVAAWEDQAWVMQQLSLEQLASSDVIPQAAFALRTDLENQPLNDPTSAAIQFARKLTSQPQSMTDQDIIKLEHHFDAQEIAEIVYHTGLAAMLNRLTIVACIVSTK